MPRNPSPRCRSPKPQSLTLTPRLGPLKAVLGKLRDIAVGLGLISALSFLPQSVVRRLPVHAQTAIGITTDIRTLLVNVGRDSADDISSLLGDLALLSSGTWQRGCRRT